MLPCLFLAKEAPPGALQGVPQVVHNHPSPMHCWQDYLETELDDDTLECGGRPELHESLSPKIQTPVEIDIRIMLGPLPPSAHYHFPQDCHSHRQTGWAPIPSIRRLGCGIL